MAAPSPLPASPALELDGPSLKLAKPIVVSGQPGNANTYRLPGSYQNDDLCYPGDPPASLGAFYAQPKGK